MEMCHSGVDTLVISRPRARAPDKTAIIVEDRSFPKAPATQSVHGGFTVLILQLSHVLKSTRRVTAVTVQIVGRK